MLLVSTRVAPSSVQGLGLFAVDPIAVGTPVWRYMPPFDQLIDIAEVRAAPASFRAFFDTYCYESHDFPSRYVLSCDQCKVHQP